jgi:hypothetical protein
LGIRNERREKKININILKQFKNKIMIATILIVFMMTIRLGVNLAKHGEEVDRRFSFPRQLLVFLINIGVLYAAGLFDKFF